MGKRKGADPDLPQAIDLQDAEGPSTSGRSGPLAIYFPSGFQPGRHGSCTWEVHTNTARQNDHLVVARSVRMVPPYFFMFVRFTVMGPCIHDSRFHS